MLYESHSVQELQGYYGPYQADEMLLQRIWSQGLYDSSRLKDQCGRTIVVESPGEWNRLGGPDFKNARLRIGSRLIEGDVEIHFSQKDWNAHAHSINAAYDNVVLHVVYHALDNDGVYVYTSRGEAIPSASLVGLLWYSLEEYAEEASIAMSTSSGDGLSLVDAIFRGASAGAQRQMLVDAALLRWQTKKRYASSRIDMLGWEGACHQTAMEILGFRRNRAAMLQAAALYSLKDVAAGKAGPDELLAAGEGKWQRDGTRPANYPKLRVEQYCRWARQRPRWPGCLVRVSRQLPASCEDGPMKWREYRKLSGMSALKAAISDVVLGDEVGGSRFDTLVCDGFLPLLSARGLEDYFGLWFNWYAGDFPEVCRQALKRLDILDPSHTPNANGWNQGMLSMLRS